MKDNYRKALLKAQIGTKIKPPKKYQSTGSYEGVMGPVPHKGNAPQIVGCTNPDAQNFNPSATVPCQDCCAFIQGFSNNEVSVPTPVPGIGPQFKKGGQYSSNMMEALKGYKKGGSVK
jgi:hypothetical protein|tara:strand:+ start:272 stop:625 length:354 start_codon:yes stop_codon:yes gene_type:complete